MIVLFLFLSLRVVDRNGLCGHKSQEMIGQCTFCVTARIIPQDIASLSEYQFVSPEKNSWRYAMKRLTLSVLASVLALAAAGPASAADLPRPAYKAPIYTAPFSWTGLYVGINAGYGWGNTEWSNVFGTSGTFRVTGPEVGGTIGYNLQTGAWVWGLEADLDWAGIRGTTSAGMCTATFGSCETRNTWMGTARGRIGYAWDRFMLYATGGAAFGALKLSTATGLSETKTKLGWTLGGGVEWAFAGAWSAKLEYLWEDLGKVNCCNTVASTDVRFNTSLVRIGVNYRF